MTTTQETPEETLARLQAPPVPKHLLSIANAEGDNRIMWDPRDADEVKVAREAFDKAKKKKMLAYTVKDDGSKGEVIRDFDPSLSKIIMTKQLAGG